MNFLTFKEANDFYDTYRLELLQMMGDEATELFDYMDEKGFHVMPASLNHHLNTQGGLLIHSINVASSLQNMTNKLGLEWENERSPILIGLIHDLCKLEFYTATKVTADGFAFKHNESPEYNLGGHGMLSVVIAQKFVKLTDEEIHCIRFHMGAYEQKDWSMFDAAIRKYPNVLYTHTADMIASKILED